MKQTFQIQTLPIDPELPLRDNLLSIFTEGGKLKISTGDNSCRLEWSAMYDSPGIISPKFLFTLCALFGTDDVDVDGFAYGGCETCDWGSSYGHTIDIKGITQNMEAVQELDGTDLLKQP